MKAIKKAYAKINLTLDILDRRKDGYHNIVSIMQSLSLCDKLILRKTKKGIFVSWDASPACDLDNTVHRAIRLMFSEFNLDGGISAFIEKRIPISAGLGGGSADAAAAILGINEIYGLNIKRQRLIELGKQIGADVPFCLTNGAAIAEGIGDVLTTLSNRMSGYVVLVKPDISISSKEAFAKIDKEGLTRRFDSNLAITALKAADYKNLGQNLYNTMELVAFPEYPIIKEIKKKMITQGAQGALMSGSGPTVYGIFENRILAENAYNYFKNTYKGALPVEAFICDFYYPQTQWPEDELAPEASPGLRRGSVLNINHTISG